MEGTGKEWEDEARNTRPGQEHEHTWYIVVRIEVSLGRSSLLITRPLIETMEDGYIVIV
jgi:hypothetical protein